MPSQRETRDRRQRRAQALQRYKNDRLRNTLAQPGIHSFVIVLDNLKAGFNVPKIFRSAETFGAREVHLINIGPFDPSPAKGAFRKIPARFHDTITSCYDELTARGYTLFTLEANCSNTLYDTPLPQKSAFILGNEGLGICFNRDNYPDIGCLAIPRFGDTESLNVSVAASVVMYEYVRQYRSNPAATE